MDWGAGSEGSGALDWATAVVPNKAQAENKRARFIVDIENLVAANSDRFDLDWIKAEWQNLAGLDDPRMCRLLELISDSKPMS